MAEMGQSENQYHVLREAMYGELLGANRAAAAVSDAMAPYLEPRHPSQLYEGALEGVALLAVLWWVRVRYPNAPHGTLTGLFFGFYALFRIVAEQFREPDAAMVGFLTKGQFLSLFMLLFAAGFLRFAWSQRRPAPEAGLG